MEESKKVIEFEDNDGFIEGYGTITRVIYECPNCNSRLIKYESRCYKCEQKLEW